MRPIVTDVPWSLCVCVLDTNMSCAKTAKQIEMPFGMWTVMGSKNYALCGGPENPGKEAIFGRDVSICRSGFFSAATTQVDQTVVDAGCSKDAGPCIHQQSIRLL